jgi:hypothetical protein
MVRFVLKTLAVIAAIATASMLSSSFSSSAIARGGPGHPGGFGHMGGFSHIGGFGQPGGFAPVGGFGHPGGFGHFGEVRALAFRGDGFRLHHGVAFRRRFFADRFAFVGLPFGYDDDCYMRVWTRWGWRWVNACY